MIPYPTQQSVSPPSRMSLSAEATLTLSEEHALLLRQVATRIEDLLIATTENRWPHRQLQSLLCYLRSEVMRQVVDEEWLLLPIRTDRESLTTLEHDHARLRADIDALAQAESMAQAQERGEPVADGVWTLEQLARATTDLLTLLEHHLGYENGLLTAASKAHALPATSVLTGRSHEWYPLTEGDVIDLDSLPAGQAVDAIVERLLRLPVDARVELRSRGDLHGELSKVWRWMNHLDAGGYGFAYLQEGPRRWVMQVTRRPVPHKDAVGA